MGRVEKYRQLRALRQKYFFSIVIFFTLFTAGFCAADCSVNSLMDGQKGLNFFTLNNYGSYIEVVFMNKKIDIDTEYVNKDLNRLRQQASRILGKGR